MSPADVTKDIEAGLSSDTPATRVTTQICSGATRPMCRVPRNGPSTRPQMSYGHAALQGSESLPASPTVNKR